MKKKTKKKDIITVTWLKNLRSSQTKKNPQDATNRNVRAANRQIALIWTRLSQTEDSYERRLRVLETEFNRLVKKVKKLEAWADDPEHR